MIPQSMPLFILTGFLGSGKTTLLQRILRAKQSEDTGVLINEFGEAGLDHRILSHVADAKTVVQSGCICCSVKPELTRGLLDLVRQSLAGEVPRFERLVIETSGLSDPASIINTIQSHTVLREYFRVAGVLTTVDAVNGLQSLERHPEVAKQISVADLIAVTKTDLASPEGARVLAERIGVINPIAEVIDARSGDLDFGELLVERRHEELTDRIAANDISAHNVSTFSLTIDEPLEWSAFIVWLSLLLTRHGERVLRLKGILSVADEAAPIVVHGVQHIMHPPEHLSAWPDADRRSRIVFIVQDITEQAITESLFRFLHFAIPGAGQAQFVCT